MAIIQRPFGDESDLPRMASVAHAQAPRNLHVIDLPYRLSSWAFDSHDNIGLWEDSAGELLAWAVLQPPFWTIDYALACPPELERALHLRMLAWADQRALAALDGPYGHSMWFTNVLASETNRIDDLIAAGYADQADVGADSWKKGLMQRSGVLPVASCALLPNFVIRPLDGAREAQAYVKLHQEAFGSKNMTLAWRLRTLRHQEYRPELDLVVQAPDGSLAAFCVGWFDTVGRYGSPAGQIEPMGVGAAYRRHGLARAILAEVLRRLIALGAQHIFVETDNQLDAAYALY